MEIYSYKISTGLVSLGWSVTVLTSDPHYRERGKHCLNNVRIKYVPALKIAGVFLPIMLHQQLCRGCPAIVHTNGPEPYSDIAALFAKIRGIPCVMTHHAKLQPPSGIRRLLARMEEHLFRFLYDMMIVTTSRLEHELHSYFPQDRVHVIPLAAGNPRITPDVHITIQGAREKLALPLDKYLVLFVGRLDSQHYYKGLDLLLESFALLEALEQRTRLIIIGNGDMRQSYESLSCKLGISNRVLFCGSVSDDELVQYYAAADLFVLPSSSEAEGFGIVLLEAMSMGVPVVTTDKPGLADQIRAHDAGLVVPSSEPKALANAISTILNNETLGQDLRTKSKEFAAIFNWQSTVLQTEQAYLHLLEASLRKRQQ